MAWKLAELFVELTVKGLKPVQDALTSLHGQLKQVQTGAEQVGRAATYAFSAASLALGGFIRSGISASAVGDVLSFQMERLSRSVAGLFGPEIRKVIDWISQLNQRMAALADAQREQIVQWVKSAAAGLAVAIVLPRIVAGITAMVNGVRAATVAFTALNASTGGILVVVGALVTALAAMGAASEVGQGGVGGLTGSLQALMAAAGEVFARIATAMAPVFEVGQRLFESLKPLLAALAELFVKLVEAIAPVVAVIGEMLIPLIQLLTVVVGILSAFVNENTIKWIAAVAAFVAVIAIVPRVIAAISAVITALRALTIAQIIQKAMSGPQGWAELAAGAAIAAVAVGAAAFAYYKVGQAAEDAGKKADALSKKTTDAGKGGRSALAPKITGFESLEAAYQRIAVASLKATAGFGKSDSERQIEELQGIKMEQMKTRQAIEAGKPLWGK